jgi:hypothetical protein
MAEENDGGVHYLQALKQSGSSATSTAAAPARKASSQTVAGPDSGPGTTPMTPGLEKRRSPRYKCEGSLELRVADSEVRTWAKFTDISMHGCYVEAATTFPVGSKGHLKLEANGFQVSTKGEVRVSYPNLGMGIAFRETSEEDGRRLRELLKTVSRPSVIVGPRVASALRPGARESAPIISDASAAIQALLEFFEHRHMLMREEFLRILRKSQGAG